MCGMTNYQGRFLEVINYIETHLDTELGSLARSIRPHINAKEQHNE